MVIQSDSCLFSLQSLPMEILENILKIGLQEGIFDFPDIKNFKLVSRQLSLAVSKNSNNLWLVALQKISDSLAQKIIKLREIPRKEEQKDICIFELFKKEISKVVFQAKETNPLLRNYVEKEISINNITIEKIIELKRRILREGGHILITYSP